MKYVVKEYDDMKYDGCEVSTGREWEVVYRPSTDAWGRVTYRGWRDIDNLYPHGQDVPSHQGYLPDADNDPLYLIP